VASPSEWLLATEEIGYADGDATHLGTVDAAAGWTLSSDASVRSSSMSTTRSIANG
jgi:hypothetical protein